MQFDTNTIIALAIMLGGTFGGIFLGYFLGWNNGHLSGKLHVLKGRRSRKHLSGSETAEDE